jgi:putative ABC transport system permease protein
MQIKYTEKRFPQFMDKYMGDDMKRLGAHFSLSLLPMKDVYFTAAR